MANTRNIEANFLDFKKMQMVNVLLTEFAEEHKKLCSLAQICLGRVRATPLPPPSRKNEENESDTNACV